MTQQLVTGKKSWEFFTFKPSSTNCFSIAAPIPELAPVTIITLPIQRSIETIYGNYVLNIEKNYQSATLCGMISTRAV
jgi:hypothetical protein